MSKIRIVIAEDHAFVRESTRQLLASQPDMEVVGEAADGLQAVEMVERARPDVAIVDIAMPKLNGIEATRRIKTQFPQTKVLILTAYDDDQYIFALLEAGAAGYVLKNIRSGELVEAVRAVYAGESVLHPAVARKVLARLVPSRAAPGEAAPEPLTEREREILLLAARGLRNKEIARQLSLSSRTVQIHLSHIFEKLGVASRTEAVVRGLRLGWLRLEDLGDPA